MKVGYLMNSYPMVSTTFIGREIQALEAQGAEVRRYAIRRWDGPLVDANDQAEAARSNYLLEDGALRLLGAFLAEGAVNPGGLWRAVAVCRTLLRNADGGAVRHTAYLLEAVALRRRLRRDPVDHVHAHFSTNAAAVALMCRALGGPPYSVTVHGPDEFFEPPRTSLGLKIAGAAFVACISNFCRHQCMIFSDRQHWDKLRIVHCGIDPARYGTPPREAGGKRVLFIGRLSALKGPMTLLDAFARVLADHPSAELTLIGDGPERAVLEERALALGCEAQVRFTGYLSQSDVADALAQADLFVLPSLAEGVPVVLMEAMASRIPVVTTRITGVPELVEDGVAGRLVPPGDTNALAGVIAALLADPGLRARMGAAGRDKVEQEFDVSREATRLLSMFRETGISITSNSRQ